MAHIRVLQIVYAVKGSKDADSLKLLPGTFKNDRDATNSIKEMGDYVFLPVHSITVKKGSKNGTTSIPEGPEEE